jgi:regulator of protease activity HflC (stomatin/prohibitin superfamily)
MKKFVMLVVMIVMAMSLTGCMTTIEPGYVGIKINKTGDNRGVSKENICAGWVFYLPITTKIVEYPVFNQRVSWSATKSEGNPVNEELTFQTKDNVPVSMDVAVNYTLLEAKVPQFYNKFRADNISSFTHGFLRDQARNAVTQIGSEYTFDDINGVKKEEFLTKLNIQLAKAVGEDGVQIASNGVSLIGAMRVPENLRNAINARVQSIQDAIKSENDLRKMKAEAAKTVATAEGEATAMRVKAAALSPQFMELKRLEIQEDWIKKWDGKMPITMLGAGAGGNMMFNIPVK